MTSPVTGATLGQVAQGLTARWRGDVRLRLYGGVLCAVVLVTSLYTAYNVRALRVEAQARAVVRADEIVQVLSHAIARPLFDINSVAVASVVAALGASPDVAYIAVLGPDGGVIAESRQALPSHAATLVQTAVPVRYVDGDKTYSVGLVDLTLRSSTQDGELSARIREVVVANLLLALAIVGLLVLLERRMARPFADIETSLNKLAAGDTAIELSGLERTDQLGQMSAAVRRFQQTLEELHATQAHMRGINEGLEQAVEERTRTLAHAVEQVRAGRAQLQAVVDHSLDAVVLVDDAGLVAEWNARATELFGWPAADAVGQPLLALLQPVHAGGEAMVWVRPSTMVDTRGPLLQWQVRHRDGRTLPVEWVMARLNAQGETGSGRALGCVFVRDVSDRLQAEAKERAALAKQAELFELRSTFIAMASHEFRTPLTAILSSVEMLRAYRHRLSNSEQDELLTSTEKGVARMTRLLERVLLIGQTHAEQLAFVPQPVKLLACVKQVTDELCVQFPGVDQRLKTVLPEGDPVACLDDNLLRDVLGNLLSNAVKYSPGGGEVELTIRPSAEGWVIEVSDHGIGIPDKELPHVFESFHRASNVQGISGTGLGLAIVKRAVDLHHGRIEAVSHGGLTRFTVVLPEGNGAPQAPLDSDA